MLKNYIETIRGIKFQALEYKSGHITFGAPIGSGEDRRMFDDLVYYNQTIYNGKIKDKKKIIKNIEKFIDGWKKKNGVSAKDAKIKELMKSVKEDLREIEDNDNNRPEEEKLGFVESLDFDARENTIFDLGMQIAYENVLERMAVTDKEYNGE